MAQFVMLAGGIVERGTGLPGVVSATIAARGERGATRLFRVRGPADAPSVEELDPATTVDITRFKRELAQDLAPVLDELRGAGGAAAITQPRPEWVLDVVRRHLEGRR